MTFSAVLGRSSASAGSPVADVGHSGGRAGVLDEDLAFEVGDGDLVALDDDQDVLEAVASVDLVGDPGQHECPGAGQLSHGGTGRQVLRWGRGAQAPDGGLDKERRGRLGTRCLGLGGGLPGGLGRDPARESLVGSLGVVDVVERVDLGLQAGQAGGEGLLVEVAETGSGGSARSCPGWWACRACR